MGGRDRRENPQEVHRPVSLATAEADKEPLKVEGESQHQMFLSDLHLSHDLYIPFLSECAYIYIHHAYPFLLVPGTASTCITAGLT